MTWLILLGSYVDSPVYLVLVWSPEAFTAISIFEILLYPVGIQVKQGLVPKVNFQYPVDIGIPQISDPEFFGKLTGTPFVTGLVNIHGRALFYSQISSIQLWLHFAVYLLTMAIAEFGSLNKSCDHIVLALNWNGTLKAGSMLNLIFLIVRSWLLEFFQFTSFKSFYTRHKNQQIALSEQSYLNREEVSTFKVTMVTLTPNKRCLHVTQFYLMLFV